MYLFTTLNYHSVNFYYFRRNKINIVTCGHISARNGRMVLKTPEFAEAYLLMPMLIWKSQQCYLKRISEKWYWKLQNAQKHQKLFALAHLKVAAMLLKYIFFRLDTNFFST